MMSLTNLMLSAHIVILAGSNFYLKQSESSHVLPPTRPRNTNKGGAVKFSVVCVLWTVYTELRDKTKDIQPIRRESLCQILGQGNFLQGAAFWVREETRRGREGEGGNRESCIVRKSTMERTVLSVNSIYDYYIMKIFQTKVLWIF